MLTIGIDCRLINQTGVGVYIRNLIYYLPNNKNITYVLFLMDKTDLPKEIKRKDIKVINTPFKWHSISEQLQFLKALLYEKLDLMHFTYFSYPILYKKPFIATIHDITPRLFRTGKASLQNNLLYVIKNIVFKYVIKSQTSNANHIIVPSHSVKNELMKITQNLLSNKITVTHEGLDYRFIQQKKNINLKNLSSIFYTLAIFIPIKILNYYYSHGNKLKQILV